MKLNNIIRKWFYKESFPYLIYKDIRTILILWVKWKISYTKEDGRSTIIKLTRKSKALEKIYQDITNEMIIQYYDGFSEEEIRAFESTLERVVKNLEKRGN